MIRFESSDTTTPRNAPGVAKAASPAIAAPTASDLDSSSDGLFSSETAESSDEQGTEGKKPRGRSRKFRS